MINIQQSNLQIFFYIDAPYVDRWKNEIMSQYICVMFLIILSSSLNDFTASRGQFETI